MECPITYYEKNLIFNQQKQCWAAFKMVGFNFEYLSEVDKDRIFFKLIRFIGSFVSMKILVVPTYDDVTEHFKRLKKTIPKNWPVRREAMEFLNMQCEHLGEAGAGKSYTTYILVKLIDEDDVDTVKAIQGSLIEFFKEPLEKLKNYFEKKPENIPEYRYKKFKVLETKYMRKAYSEFKVQRLQEGEIQWLLKKCMYRGIDNIKSVPLNKTVKTLRTPNGEEKEIYSTDWQPHARRDGKYIRPNKRDIINLFSGEIEQGNRHIKVTHDDGTVSYQTFLSITNMPDSIVYPDRVWLYDLYREGVEVETCITIDNVEYLRAKDSIGFRKRKIEGEIDEVAETGFDITEDLYNSKRQIEELESELKDNRLPLCNVSVSFCVASENLEYMEIMADIVKKHYNDSNFTIERSISDQLKLFMEFIPGTERYVESYKLKLSPTAIAAGVYGVNNKLGDEVGYFIGTHGPSNQRVYLYLGNASLENQSPAGTFYGNLGYGKSFNANLILYLHVLFGGKALIFDPKSERSHWPEELPILGPYTKVITIDASDEHKGKADPFNIFRGDPNTAGSKAVSLLSDFFNIDMDDERFTILTEAVEIVKRKKRPSMQMLIDVLKGWVAEDEWSKQAVSLGRQIESLKKTGVSKLIIGDGTEDAITFDNLINILQIQGLTIPGPEKNRNEYKQEEVVSELIMGIFCDFANKFANTVKGFKVSLIDESWFLKNTTEGRALMENTSRVGRSQYISTLLNGHSVKDIPSEATRNAMTYKFCFHTDNRDEAERMLEYMGLDISDENINMIMNLENRQCLFQDQYKRVGLLTFDALFDDLIKVFGTTPVDEDKNQINEDEVKHSNFNKNVDNEENLGFERDMAEYDKDEEFQKETDEETKFDNESIRKLKRILEVSRK